MVGRGIGLLTTRQKRAELLLYVNIAGRGETVREVPAQFAFKGGGRLHVLLTMSPIRRRGLVEGVCVVCRDVTQRRQNELQRLWTMETQRRHIGHHLYESLGQKLTGLSFLSRALHRKLAARKARESAAAVELEKLSGESVEMVRRLALGMSPVGLDSRTLPDRLRELSAEISKSDGVLCRFRQNDLTTVGDSLFASHVYQIAQGAILDAVKRGRAGRINVSLSGRKDGCTLSVRDNGIAPPSRAPDSHAMQVSKSFASFLGSTLEMRPGPSGGAIVTCPIRYSDANADF
jgi:signal transduction histidine kinase